MHVARQEHDGIARLVSPAIAAATPFNVAERLGRTTVKALGNGYRSGDGMRRRLVDTADRRLRSRILAYPIARQRPRLLVHLESSSLDRGDRHRDVDRSMSVGRKHLFDPPAFVDEFRKWLAVCSVQI